MDKRKEAENQTRACGIPSGSGCHHHVFSDTLFSTSLPVLPHEKLQLNDNIGRSPPTDDVALGSNEFHDSVDDLLGVSESHAIGNLLPDDEDDLLAGILGELDLSELSSTLEEVDDYDIFGSGGGLELENDLRDNLSLCMPRIPLSKSVGGNVIPHYNLQNGLGTVVAGEHPYGEHPSRTLFVRNINSNVEDTELRALFEQYGDIRTLYMACKHRGFVMISYYDIRAARMAMRALQNKPLRRRKLDIHFSIPKDNPSEKDLNQGTLVVFNLDPSVSNDDLHQVFGAYGEIKEIRETPHKKHHKFIEFYDVRAAEAALKALNRCEIAGKRIKVEPSRPGGARRSLMLQLNKELEHDDLHGPRHLVGSPVTNSPPGNWLQWNSPVECSPLQTIISKSPVFGAAMSPNDSQLSGLASVLNPQAMGSKLAPIGRDPGKFGHAGGHPFQQYHPSQEPKLEQYAGNLPSFVSSASNGGAFETLSGSEFLWGSPNSRSELSSSSVWSSSSIGNPISADSKNYGFAYSSQLDLAGLPRQNHSRLLHVGSAPSGIPLERHLGFFSESSRDTSFTNPVGFRGNAGMGLNGGSFPSSLANTGIINTRNLAENGFPSYRRMSSPKLSPVLLSGSLYPGWVPSSFGGLSENGRARRVENNVNRIESRKQFQLDLDKIISGEDTRTTLMIKNIPNKYTSKMLLAAIDEKNKGTYDFLYLPIDFKNKCNVGDAFINMLSPDHIVPFYEAFNGKKWEKFNSEKVASLAYARIQGKVALIAHFQNSSLMNEDVRCRPIIFHTHDNLESVEREHLECRNFDVVSLPKDSTGDDTVKN